MECYFSFTFTFVACYIFFHFDNNVISITHC